MESEKLSKQQKKLKKDEDEVEEFEKNNTLLQENELRKEFLLQQIVVRGLGAFAKFKYESILYLNLDLVCALLDC